MDHADVARSYYDALDAHDYDRLSSLLAPGFVQRRPDRTFEGREAFVSFMREGRPQADTTHEVDALYRREGDEEVAVRGRLFDADGEELVAFVDVFRFDGGRAVELWTYTR
ncbi:nuclear transport factor 2 family protein [Halegenticoccus tardaugens]|uniref:nuclear transport factor 2 family protein n=1 Tax=Halegenticoccus tardaugens TaxID=2071624 RepID=UPI00100B36E3|nr:nuclear transport factor 2 family protein [Halegenticoccus tardaugens]